MLLSLRFFYWFDWRGGDLITGSAKSTVTLEQNKLIFTCWWKPINSFEYPCSRCPNIQSAQPVTVAASEDREEGEAYDGVDPSPSRDSRLKVTGQAPALSLDPKSERQIAGRTR